MCGKIFGFDDLEFTLSFTATKSNTGATKGQRVDFDFNTLVADSPITTAYGVRISGYSIEGDGAFPPPWNADASRIRVQVPTLGIDQIVDSGSFATSGTATLSLSDGGFYITQERKWRIVAASASLVINGSSVWSDTNIDEEMGPDAVLGPASCLLMGAAANLIASCAIGPSTPTFSWHDGGSDYTADATIDVTAGWRFKEPGSASWTALPVTPYAIPDVALSCVVDAGLGAATATNTYDLNVTAMASASHVVTVTGPHSVDPECPIGQYAGAARTINVTQTDVSYEEQSGSIGAQVDLTRIMKRWVPADHAELVYRGGFPETTMIASEGCYNYSVSGEDISTPSSSDSITTTVHPSRSNYLGVPLGTTHVIEDPLADTNYAYISVAGDKWTVRNKTSTVISAGSCGFTPPGNSYPHESTFLTGCYARRNTKSGVFPASVEDSTSNPDLIPYLDHLDERVRYQNYISDPHWSFVNWFPENTVDTDADLNLDSQTIWEVGGVETPVEYWLSLKQQYLSHGSLGLADNRRTRTCLPLTPTMESHFASWWPSNIGGEDVAAHWWGNTRFHVVDTAFLNLPVYTSASSPLWTGTDCSLAHAASITVTPTTTTPVVELELGSYTEELYLFPLVAQAIDVNWSGANITACGVYLESRSGDRVLLGSIPDFLALEGSPDSEYAGSWGQDYGSGYVTTTGTDTQTGGVSAAVMLEDEGTVNYKMLPARMGAKIRFEFTLSNTDPFTLDYPTLQFDPDPPMTVQEHSHHAAFIVPNGSFVRFGQHQWWDGSTLTVPPTVIQPGWPPIAGFWTSSLLDALCWRRVVVEGIAADDGLDTEIASIFDSVEGQSRSRADTGTIGMLMAGGATGRMVHVVSLRSVPPLSSLPERSRNTTTMQPTEAWAQESWAYAVEPRRIVAPGIVPVHLTTPGGTVWTADDTSVDGWTITMHRRPVDNLEGVNYKVMRGASDWAEVSPWFGYTCVIDLAPVVTTGVCLSMDAHPDGRRFRAYIQDGNAVVGFCSRNSAFLDTDTGIAVDWLAIRIDKGAPTPKLYLITQEGTAIKERESTTSGVSFGVATTLATGYKYPTIDVELDGVRLVYFVNTLGTAVYGIGRDKEGNTLWGPTSVHSGIDDSPIAVRKQVMANGLATIFLTVIEGGAVVEYLSTDGKTFV